MQMRKFNIGANKFRVIVVVNKVKLNKMNLISIKKHEVFKSILLAIFTFLVTSSTFCQDTITKYIDNNDNETTAARAAYKRKIYRNGEIWIVKDYFLDGNLQMIGEYTSNNLKSKNGNFIYYHQNGQKDAEGKYVKNERSGDWFYWYDNGQQKKVLSYDETGLLSGASREYYPSGKLKFEGSYALDKFDGVCKWYFENGAPSSIEKYNVGELQSIQFYNEDGTEMEGVFKAEVAAEYEGGSKAFNAFLASEIQYPRLAMKKKIEGVVKVQFVVNKNGDVEKVRILNSVHPLLDEEALRVVRSLKAWKPAKAHNLLVESYYDIPIRFKL